MPLTVALDKLNQLNKRLHSESKPKSLSEKPKQITTQFQRKPIKKIESSRKSYKKPITSQIRSKPGKVKKSPAYKSQLQKATTTMPSLPVYPKQISTEKPKISRHTLPSKFYQRKQHTKVPPAQYDQRFYNSPKPNSPRQKRCIDCEKYTFIYRYCLKDLVKSLLQQ